MCVFLDRFGNIYKFITCQMYVIIDIFGNINFIILKTFFYNNIMRNSV